VNEFGSNVDGHRRELLVHCYRMLGSLPDAEDAVQETLLRAWRYRDSLKEGAPLRPWLYRVATNACLDVIAHDKRRAALAASAAADEGGAGVPEDVVLARADSGLSARAFHPSGEDAGGDDAYARKHRTRISYGDPAAHTAAAGRFDSV